MDTATEIAPHIKIFLADKGSGIILIESVMTQGKIIMVNKRKLSIKVANITAVEAKTIVLIKEISRIKRFRSSKLTLKSIPFNLIFKNTVRDLLLAKK
jgi:hypothetical protein